MTERIRTKAQTMIYKTLHRKRNIEQHEPNLKPEMNSGTPEVTRNVILMMNSIMVEVNNRGCNNCIGIF